MTAEEKAKKTSSYLGFARRSGNVSIGTQTTVSAVRKASAGGKSGDIAVLVSKDASERTKKLVFDKCSFYGVFCRVSELDCDGTAKVLGKSAPVSAAAIGDESLASAIKELYSDE